MYPLLGNLRIEQSNYEGVVQMFDHARAQLRNHDNRTLSVLSLVSLTQDP